MAQSILNSVKKIIGLAPEDDSFDIDILMHINSTFFVLEQLGVGPAEGFEIEDDTQTWEQYVGNTANINAVKSYVGIKVRLLFDPPTNSFVVDSLSKQATEYEWRLNVRVDNDASRQFPKPFWWTLDANGNFPDEADIGDVGIDTAGKLWRKTVG